MKVSKLTSVLSIVGIGESVDTYVARLMSQIEQHLTKKRAKFLLENTYLIGHISRGYDVGPLKYIKNKHILDFPVGSQSELKKLISERIEDVRDVTSRILSADTIVILHNPSDSWGRFFPQTLIPRLVTDDKKLVVLVTLFRGSIPTIENAGTLAYSMGALQKVHRVVENYSTVNNFIHLLIDLSVLQHTKDVSATETESIFMALMPFLSIKSNDKSVSSDIPPFSKNSLQHISSVTIPYLINRWDTIASPQFSMRYALENDRISTSDEYIYANIPPLFSDEWFEEQSTLKLESFEDNPSEKYVLHGPLARLRHPFTASSATIVIFASSIARQDIVLLSSLKEQIGELFSMADPYEALENPTAPPPIYTKWIKCDTNKKAVIFFSGTRPLTAYEGIKALDDADVFDPSMLTNSEVLETKGFLGVTFSSKIGDPDFVFQVLQKEDILANKNFSIYIYKALLQTALMDDIIDPHEKKILSAWKEMFNITEKEETALMSGDEFIRSVVSLNVERNKEVFNVMRKAALGRNGQIVESADSVLAVLSRYLGVKYD